MMGEVVNIYGHYFEEKYAVIKLYLCRRIFLRTLIVELGGEPPGSLTLHLKMGP